MTMRVLEPEVRTRQRREARCASESYDAVLTADGKALLERKVAELRAVTLPTLERELAEDPREEQAWLSYEDAVAELRRIESVLAQAGPIPRQLGRPGQVGIGDTITVSFLSAGLRESGEAEEFLLVHPFEAPLDQRRISVLSPLGRAVLGRRTGDIVTFDAPSQRRSVQIIGRRATG